MDLEEYLVPADREPFTYERYLVIPYGRYPGAAEDQPALIREESRRTAIGVILLVSTNNQGSIECPVASMIFDPTAGSVLYIGDSFTVSFSSTIVPARVKICGRYQPQPGVNNGNEGQYTFTHTVQSGDVAGQCNVSVYLPYTHGTLPVYEEATGLTVGMLSLLQLPPPMRVLLLQT